MIYLFVVIVILLIVGYIATIYKIANLIEYEKNMRIPFNVKFLAAYGSAFVIVRFTDAIDFLAKWMNVV